MNSCTPRNNIEVMYKFRERYTLQKLAQKVNYVNIPIIGKKIKFLI